MNVLPEGAAVRRAQTVADKPETRTELAVDIRRSDAFAVVVVTGEVDVATVMVLRAALHERSVLDSPHVIIDVTGMPFADSSGIGQFCGAYKRATRIGGELSLAGANPSLLHLLRILGLLRIFQIFSTCDEAEAAVTTDLQRGQPRPAGPGAPYLAGPGPQDGRAMGAIGADVPRSSTGRPHDRAFCARPQSDTSPAAEMAAGLR